MTRAGWLLVAEFLCSVLPLQTRADVPGAVDWARQHGCPDTVTQAPLKIDTRLTNAAARLADGQSLHAALAATGYPATRSSAVHISGAVSDSQIGRALAAGDCAILTDPALTQIGIERRGRDVWLVLAAPAALPSLKDAAAIGREILDRVNAARAGARRCGTRIFAAAQPLILHAALTAAADAHAREMALHEEFEHRGHDGSTPAQRVTRAGFGGFSIVGENIAAGAMTPSDVMSGWLESPAHCENIMDPRFTSMGIGFAVNPATAELVYWTQDFAARRE